MVVRNIVLRKNEDLTYTARWTDVDGNPYDLSDAYMQIRPSGDSETLLAEATVGDGRIIIDPVVDGDGGWVYVSIPKSVVAAIDYEGPAEYDIVVTRTSDSRTKAIVGGAVIIESGVSRA